MPSLNLYNNAAALMQREIDERFTIDKLHAAQQKLVDAMGEKYLQEISHDEQDRFLIRADAVKPVRKAPALFNRKLLLRR